METYAPDILEDKYARFLVRLSRCPTCDRHMVVDPGRMRGTFPYYHKLDFRAQAKAASLATESDARTQDNKLICTDCKHAGKASFICASCKREKSSDKIQEQFGDPPEFLCTDCYETISAKEWEEIMGGLDGSHEWDYV